mgnify:CR=1 FL=1
MTPRRLLRIDRFCHDATSRYATAATDRHNNGFHLRQAFDDFNCVGSDARNQERLIAGVNKTRTGLSRLRLGKQFGVVKIASMKNDLRTHAANGLDFHRIGVLRQHDRRPHPEEP